MALLLNDVRFVNTQGGIGWGQKDQSPVGASVLGMVHKPEAHLALL